MEEPKGNQFHMSRVLLNEESILYHYNYFYKKLKFGLTK